MRRGGRAVGVALVGATAAVWVTERVTEASWPTLVASHPAVLVASTSHVFPQLLLAARRLPTVTFAAVLAAHAAVVCALGYVTGRRLGEPAVLRLIARVGSTAGATKALQRVRRIGVPLTVVSPVLLVALLVGAVETPALPFAAAVLAAIVVRVVLLTVLRDAFGSSLDHVLIWVNRWQWPIVAASAIVVVGGVLLQRRRGAATDPPEADVGVARAADPTSEASAAAAE